MYTHIFIFQKHCKSLFLVNFLLAGVADKNLNDLKNSIFKILVLFLNF